MEKGRPHIRLSRSDRSLAYKDALRVLEVMFDDRLLFYNHADYLREKTELMIATIGSLAQMQGGYLRPERRPYIAMCSSRGSRRRFGGANYADCRPSFRVVSLQRHVLLGLLGAFRTTRTTAQQVLINAPPITLELEQVNSEFNLIVIWKWMSYQGVSLYPDEILPIVDPWQDHSAARITFGFRQLTQDGPRRITRAPEIHVYTDGSFS
ncbi:hypothetical protein HPB50_014589 [Hyalomma asiaticum]|uniref:Uncharacterized protein n=1 Tax=Hyalomma asiaticum TaxID=266040 RepID=A0ACB7T2L8_HYAAI|nr:hypothetical protein HPB50_014589 [Hyalomma asiaticum]